MVDLFSSSVCTALAGSSPLHPIQKYVLFTVSKPALTRALHAAHLKKEPGVIIVLAVQRGSSKAVL